MTGATGNKEWLAMLINDAQQLKWSERQRAGNLNDPDPIYDEDDEVDDDEIAS